MFRAFSNRKSAFDKDNIQDEEAKLPQPYKSWSGYHERHMKQRDKER